MQDKRENRRLSELDLLKQRIIDLEAKNARPKQIIEENAKRDVRVEELEQKNTELEARLAILEQVPTNSKSSEDKEMDDFVDLKYKKTNPYQNSHRKKSAEKIQLIADKIQDNVQSEVKTTPCDEISARSPCQDLFTVPLLSLAQLFDKATDAQLGSQTIYIYVIKDQQDFDQFYANTFYINSI
ncbi:hypothetical protein Glove_193g13 [Diversispora epigaea]|uniref:Uncharacterized protein n=1 Tax=Diversispora epigaea TaxID=1348612 RepID=A0A397IVX6_9GLOM|nr:hypothetical protein Glove_193g13 [Diversispora epigaea]